MPFWAPATEPLVLSLQTQTGVTLYVTAASYIQDNTLRTALPLSLLALSARLRHAAKTSGSTAMAVSPMVCTKAAGTVSAETLPEPEHRSSWDEGSWFSLACLTWLGLGLTCGGCGRAPAPESTAVRAKREQTALTDRQRSAVKFASIQPPAAPARAARPPGAPLQPARVRALPWNLH